MNAFIGALRELWGLFVEDLSLTIGIALSLVVAAFALPIVVPPRWRGVILFLLCAGVLLENCRRSARRA
jgi:hypothetical protein